MNQVTTISRDGIKSLYGTPLPTFRHRISALCDVFGAPDGHGRKQWLSEFGGVHRHTARRWLDEPNYNPSVTALEEFVGLVARTHVFISPNQLLNWLRNGNAPENRKEPLHGGDFLLLFRIALATDRMLKTSGVSQSDPLHDELVTKTMEHLLKFCQESQSSKSDELLFQIATSVRLLIETKQL